eukprot:CAMPEP_0202890204 /NCGR_PEP_ID=MMETSP1392-20130828/708_1 /ASSEMBLY_ACC=CAM_ASM_000868 /TAXON_ID=225041 /ORGANISM="Chlamydomonas chlamydogama, Strain SAG 11-48b" /LENGTH=251 /DNA_ID=CAMNT_0049573741 /DNA_START=41 /DNA_END=796 /DNA_ORIENTATION=+
MSSAVELLDQAIAKLDGILGASASAPAPRPAAAAPISTPAANASSNNAISKAAAPAKSEGAKKGTAAASPAAAGPAAGDDSALFSKALIKVARILTISDLPNSEKLYKLSVDVGGGQTKQVCAGLRQYLASDSLAGALVSVVLNLRPAKLAGELSEAMILAAEAQGEGGKLLVRPLVPPAGSEPGDVVFLSSASGPAPEAAAKQIKSDDWKKILDKLAVQASKPCFAGIPLVTVKGGLSLPAEIPDGSSIH